MRYFADPPDWERSEFLGKYISDMCGIEVEGYVAMVNQKMLYKVAYVIDGRRISFPGIFRRDAEPDTIADMQTIEGIATAIQKDYNEYRDGGWKV